MASKYKPSQSSRIGGKCKKKVNFPSFISQAFYTPSVGSLIPSEETQSFFSGKKKGTWEECGGISGRPGTICLYIVINISSNWGCLFPFFTLI